MWTVEALSGDLAAGRTTSRALVETALARIAERTDGVRVARFPATSPLADEWAVLLVGAHYNGALVARRLDGIDCYDFAVTHERDLVVEAGRALLRHVSPNASW